MGQRSVILLILLVLGITFSLLYLAIIAKSSYKEDLVQSLEVTDASAYIARTTNPQNICFALNQDILTKYPALASAMTNADQAAQGENRITNSMTNQNKHAYSSFSIDNLPKNDVLSLMRDYDFNETVPYHYYVEYPFTKQDEQFNCGFRYLDKYYSLTLVFTTLENVTGTHGYSGIHITPTIAGNYGFPSSEESSHKSIITYAPFNNTIVFFNDLKQPLTIEVSNLNNSQMANETLSVPPNRIADIYLSPNWDVLADDLYHYQVKEYPSINGDIAIVKKYNTECMDNRVAKSIYSQRNFDVQFPSYLPAGFKQVCNSQNTDTYLIQVYANETAAQNYKRLGLLHPQSNSNPYAYYLYPTMSQEELTGLLLIHAQKSFNNDPQAELYKSYKLALNDTSGYLTSPRFHSVNGTSYYTFYAGNILPTVDVAKGDSGYRVEGLLPMPELERVAKSLSPQ